MNAPTAWARIRRVAALCARTPLRLVELSRLAGEAADCRHRPPRRRAGCTMADPMAAWQAAPAQPAAYAHDLYANLRVLDALGVDPILVEASPAGRPPSPTACPCRRLRRGRRRNLKRRGSTSAGRLPIMRALSGPIAQLGRALRSQCRGREFDPPSVHQEFSKKQRITRGRGALFFFVRQVFAEYGLDAEPLDVVRLGRHSL